MNWISLAVTAYFLIAVAIILDKFLLSSKRVAHPATYAFYSGLMSFFTIFLFLPFGVHQTSPWIALQMFFWGLVFFIGVFLLFYAIQKSETSRVVPVVGAIIPLVSLLVEILLLERNFLAGEIAGIFTLIFGGLLISFDLPLKLGKNKFFSGFYFSLAAGIFLAIAYSGLDSLYKKEGFINVFAWSRMGLTIGAGLLLLIPAWRKVIFDSIFGFKKSKKENIRTGNLFVFNKILNGAGSALSSYAIAIGSVSIVNALISVEYVFVFMLALVFHGFYPQIFSEKNKFNDILQKVIAIVIIASGIILITG